MPRSGRAKYRKDVARLIGLNAHHAAVKATVGELNAILRHAVPHAPTRSRRRAGDPILHLAREQGVSGLEIAVEAIATLSWFRECGPTLDQRHEIRYQSAQVGRSIALLTKRWRCWRAATCTMAARPQRREFPLGHHVGLGERLTAVLLPLAAAILTALERERKATLAWAEAKLNPLSLRPGNQQNPLPNSIRAALDTVRSWLDEHPEYSTHLQPEAASEESSIYEEVQQ